MKVLRFISTLITKGSVGAKWFYTRFAEAFAVLFVALFIFWIFRPWLMYMDPEAGLMVLDRLERPVMPGLFTIMFFLAFYMFLLFSHPQLLRYLYPEKGKEEHASFAKDFNEIEPWKRLTILLATLLLLLSVFLAMHWVLNK